MECYENIKFLGCGSFGKAFLCRKVENRKLYVAKELVVDKEITSDYENESKILMNLDHPNIVQWFDTFTINSKAVIIMEYMSGGMLSDYLKKQVGLLNEKEVIYKFVQLILALDFLHCKRIIHRDITSHNVLLSHSNNVVKLSDFGMASIINKSRKVEGIAGTPSYIAPEVLETNRSDEKSDIWSLGCVLFEMLTLKKSFKNIIAPNVLLETSYKVVLNQHQISKNFSKNLRNLVQNMLSINPDDRPNTSSLIALPFLMKFCVEVPMFLGAFYDKPLNQLEFASSGIESELSLCQNQEGSEIFVIDKSQLEEHIAIPWSNGAKIFDKLIQITANETHLYGLTEFGSLVSWEVSKKSKSSIKWKFIGSSDVNCLVKVSCGDSYVAAISDSGIIFTMGYGKFGCLGHGDFEDKLKLHAVQSLLYYDVSDMACGPHHIIVRTVNNELFTWGQNLCGCLGVNNDTVYNIPQRVKLPTDLSIKSMLCTNKNTLLLTNNYDIYYAGEKRFFEKCSNDHMHGISETWEFINANKNLSSKFKFTCHGNRYIGMIMQKDSFDEQINKWNEELGLITQTMILMINRDCIIEEIQLLHLDSSSIMIPINKFCELHCISSSSDNKSDNEFLNIFNKISVSRDLVFVLSS